jgi:Protein of unknown function (DUF4058)
MPLLDHFHPPLHPQRHWESFHVNWAGAIADLLNDRLLPEGYFAEEHASIGPRVEIDVATFEEPAPAGGGSTATLPARVWTPPAPAMILPAAFPDSFEVLIFQSEGGARLVAAIELVSPANKDRPAHRLAFNTKCGSYLAQGLALVVIDIVTTRRVNLHDEMMRLLGHGDAFRLPDGTDLYAVAYQPLVRDQVDQIHVWPAPLSLGQALPVLPLALNAEICLPLDLEATYTTACQRRRLG